MTSPRWAIIGGIVLALVLSGCVNPTTTPTYEATDNPNPIPDNQTNPILQIGPGDSIVLCDDEDLEENAECFEDALVSCQRVVGTFWSTSDGFPLAFESFGLTTEGTCSVRVTVLSDDQSETQFAGTSANCLIEKSPANEEHSTAFFDSYLIGPSTCTGSYVDAIQTTSIATETPLSPDQMDSEPTTSNVKEFSIMVSEKGVIGEKTFTVKKGDLVKLTITVDVKDVSFNGEQIIAPAQKGLEASEYIFDSGHQKPGQVQTFEFVAEESFDFGVYWPGPTVLKGKGNFVVEEN